MKLYKRIIWSFIWRFSKEKGELNKLIWLAMRQKLTVKELKKLEKLAEFENELFT
jgi:hypothetical protein